MDPAFQPINGISLERYAELGAATDGVTDPAEIARIVEGEGVAAADYEAAKVGWTARMQDMSLMGKVATAFMPLYQAALAQRKGGAARISYEDFVAVSAAIKVYGFEAGVQASGVSQSDWTEAAGDWNSTMAADMMRYAGHPNLIAQEEARLRAPGGAPRQAQVTRDASATAAPAGASAAAAGAANPYAGAMGAPAAAGVQGDPMQQAMAAAMANPAMQQAQAAQAGIMNNPVGHAFNVAGNALTGGIVPGSRVNVIWSDGNHYPGQVMNVSPGQVMVQFDNGSQQWVPEHAVKKA